jgi:hypothetical protein
MSLKATVVSGTTAAAVASLALYSFSPRVTDRDAAFKLVRGDLVNANVETGVKMDAILPHVSYVLLPKFLQRTTVHASENDGVAIRTKEKAQVFGDFEIHWTLDNQAPNFADIYTKLKCDDIKDLEPFIQNYATPSLIDTYRTVGTAAVNDNLTEVGKKIATSLQETLDKNGYGFIKVHDVIPSGVGLSKKANADLEMIVSEERKKDLQIIQGQVSEGALAITEKQVAVTAKALEGLRKAGVPEDQLLNFYYLQLMRDSDKLGEVGVPGPIPGTGMNGVVVPNK